MFFINFFESFSKYDQLLIYLPLERKRKKIKKINNNNEWLIFKKLKKNILEIKLINNIKKIK